MTDLGTLVPGGFASAAAINNAGYVVGASGPFPTYCCGWITGQQHGFLWDPASGVMRDLGVPMFMYGGGINSAGNAINESGLIAGESRIAYWETGQRLVTSEAAAVLAAAPWDPFNSATHTMVFRGSASGSTLARDVNADGLVVGEGLGPDVAFAWTEAGGFTILAALESGGPSGALAVNDAGRIVGWSTAGGLRRPVRWDGIGAAAVDLGLPPGWSWAEARDINASGWVTGYGRGADGSERAFVRDPASGAYTVLGTLGGAGSRAYGINAAGKVVGSSETAAGQTHAFAWDPATGAMLDLGVWPGDAASAAFAINDHDRAVGRSSGGGSQRAVLWTVSFVTIVKIDIKPGSGDNPIARKAKGVVPVAILTTQTTAGEAVDFDAATVDAASVRFGPGGAQEVHGRGHVEDVDGDGDLDMVLHFEVRLAAISDGATEACLEGSASGRRIRGCDAVRLLN